eukprot:4730020-Prymnesium_polylepis.1
MEARAGLNANLVYAAKSGDLDLMVVLINMGADTNAKNDLGCTALFAAVRRDHEHCAAIIRLLLQSQADPLAKSSLLDRTPLHLAAMNGNAVPVTAALTATSFPASQELLLLPQADILLTAVDREGLTPLKQYHRKPKHSFARDMMLEKSMELRHNAERKITEIKSHLQLVRAAGVTDGDTSRAEKQIIEARAVVNRLQTLEASSGLAETTLSMVSEAPEQSEADARAVEETRVRAAAEAVEADVLEIATFLEIDHTLHPDLLWIARKALFAEEDVPAEHFRELYAQRVRAKQRREGSMAAAIEAAVVTEAAPAIAPEITQTRIKPVGPSSLPISFEA